MDTQQMLERLEVLEDRFEELNRLMADPDVAQDYEKVTEYAIERSELEETVTHYRAYRDVLEETAGSEEMLQDDDPAMREMAQEELGQLSERREALEERSAPAARAQRPARREGRHRGDSCRSRGRRGRALCRGALPPVYPLRGTSGRLENRAHQRKPHRHRRLQGSDLQHRAARARTRGSSTRAACTACSGSR